LIGRDVRNEVWRMIDVVSAGSDLGCASEGAYGVYTNINPHLAWIESMVVRRYAD
jgi:secreted trypsin-like serine protease